MNFWFRNCNMSEECWLFVVCGIPMKSFPKYVISKACHAPTWTFFHFPHEDLNRVKTSDISKHAKHCMWMLSKCVTNDKWIGPLRTWRLWLDIWKRNYEPKFRTDCWKILVITVTSHCINCISASFQQQGRRPSSPQAFSGSQLKVLSVIGQPIFYSSTDQTSVILLSARSVHLSSFFCPHRHYVARGTQPFSTLHYKKLQRKAALFKSNYYLGLGGWVVGHFAQF